MNLGKAYAVHIFLLDFGTLGLCSVNFILHTFGFEAIFTLFVFKCETTYSYVFNSVFARTNLPGDDTFYILNNILRRKYGSTLVTDSRICDVIRHTYAVKLE